MAAPITGFQKYHDLKNSLTDFGFGVAVQFESIDLIFYIFDAKIKIKNN